MGKFFNKTAEKKRKSHAGTGAAIGGAAMAGNQANWVRKVNKKGTKERAAFGKTMKMLLGEDGFRQQFGKGKWKYPKGSAAAAVAVAGAMGAGLGAAAGSVFKKKKKKK